VALVVVAATGWLYTLRNLEALRVGPHVSGALPLQQLARSDDQPLLRLIVVWVPAGALAAALLSRWARMSAPAVLASIVAIAVVLLVLAGAMSDAVAISESVRGHIASQFTRAGTLVAVVLMLVGALPVVFWRR
jgi:hypothetical protein